LFDDVQTLIESDIFRSPIRNEKSLVFLTPYLAKMRTKFGKKIISHLNGAIFGLCAAHLPAEVALPPPL
jgi:hypothetical protein